MISVNYSVLTDDGKLYIEAAGVHTDDKPTNNIAPGSWVHEVDTKDVYAYDGENWEKQLNLAGE